MFTYPDWSFKLQHDGSEAFISNPLPKLNETVKIRFRAPEDAPIQTAFIRAMLDGEFSMRKMEKVPAPKGVQIWEGDLPMQQRRIDYRFKLMTTGGAYYFSAAGCKRADTPDYDSFVILADYDAPLWVREQIFYQIFPERFYNGDPSNDVQDNEYNSRGRPSIKRQWGELPQEWRKSGSMDFFGGDLQGISQKLDYIKDLGVTALYLCPIFKAETNHKYDILDFFNVDKHFGGNEALAELRRESEKRAIKLMLDITTNHISYNHPLFATVEKDHQHENAELFFYNAEKKDFERWLGVPLLVKLNYGSQQMRNIMYAGANSALKHWLNEPYNIDAWRFDVANMTGNMYADQLDNDVWREVRQELKAHKPDVYMLGEYFQDAVDHLQGDELDASMNYQGFNIPMRRWLGGEDIAGHDNNPYSDKALLPTEALAEQWLRFMGVIPYPIALQQFNQLDSHDTTRLLHVTDGDKALAKLGLALLFAFPGVPCIYYGTEIGMTGFKDPDNRRTMIWDEAEWDQDLLAFTKKLSQIRKDSHALKHGGFHVLHAEGDTVVFLRESQVETMLCVGYRGKETLSNFELAVGHTGLKDGEKLNDAFTGRVYQVTKGKIQIPTLAHGAVCFLQTSPS